MDKQGKGDRLWELWGKRHLKKKSAAPSSCVGWHALRTRCPADLRSICPTVLASMKWVVPGIGRVSKPLRSSRETMRLEMYVGQRWCRLRWCRYCGGVYHLEVTGCLSSSPPETRSRHHDFAGHQSF